VTDTTTRAAITAAITTAYDAIDASGQPEIWIHLRPFADALVLADDIATRVEAGEELALAGWTVAVKDNIDVAGMPTTVGTRTALLHPTVSAATVARLESAGAIVIGKTTMDQFATGLVGTRTPYGIPHASGDATRISGGSSSGSALAVALGLTDISLGTDTAGSGRVPAAFNNIVGIKPTLGLLSNVGVYPASPSYDTVSVFARTLPVASTAVDVMAGADAAGSRPWPADIALAPRHNRIAAARPEDLSTVTPVWRDGYERSLAALESAGYEIARIDISPLVDVAKLLYGGALIAERAQSFGRELVTAGDAADPVVASIVVPAMQLSAMDLVRDQQALAAPKAAVEQLWTEFDAILVPTAPGHPTINEVVADPVRVNAWVGTFTNFVNLLDLSALAVPATGSTVDVPVGVSLIGPGFGDHSLARIAVDAAFADAPATAEPALFWGAPHVELVVFGAHRSGQVLNHELTRVGSRLVGPAATGPQYRMARLDTTPPKPGVWRVPDGGASIRGELWALTPAGFAAFASGLVAPMVIGKVTLDDGRSVLGFLCEPTALDGAEDITGFGDWIDYRASLI